MNIAIIGAGNIGSTLGRRCLEQGHSVTFGVRDTNSDKLTKLQDELEHAVFTTPQDALTNADAVVLAVPGKVVDQVVAGLAGALEHKIIIDATNNLAEDVMDHVEVMQHHMPTAKLFRVFNSLGWETFGNPTIAGQQVDHFYCGDEGDEQQTVHQLIADIGLNPIYLGGLEHSPTLDALTRLWFTLAFQKGYGRRVALKIIAESQDD
ncbi:MAG: NAD(P)-binding domain-containing protein [Deinococcota bacterium]